MDEFLFYGNREESTTFKGVFKLKVNVIQYVHFEIKEIPIPQIFLGKRIRLLFWLLLTIANNIWFSLPIIVFFIIEFIILFISFRIFLLLLLIISAFFLSFFLEEYFHLITIISQGNKFNVMGLSIWRLLFGRDKKAVIVASTAIAYKLKNPIEKIQILSNGPLLTIFNNVVIVILLHLIYDVSFIEILIVSLSFTLLNITSLLPLQYIVITDGAKILKFKRELELSIKELSKIIFIGLFDTIYYLFTNRYRSKINLIKSYFIESYSFFQQKDYLGAINNLEEIIRLDNKNFEAYNNLACCLIMIGNIESALHNAEKAVEIAPNDPCCLETLQSLHYLQKTKQYNNEH